MAPARTPTCRWPAIPAGYAAKTNAVPLVATELPTACRHFPIVFTDGDQPTPVAVLGVRGQENLFVDAQGQWRAGAYIPAYVRRYPFIFMENEDRSQFTLCVDEQPPRWSRAATIPSSTKPASPPTWRAALEFCRDYQNQHAYTMEFARALAEADLLVENRADITLPDGQRLAMSGFKVIDEAKFNKLPDEEFLRWRANGWLPLVYCHLLSINTWPALINQLQPAAQAEEAAAEA